MTWHLLALRFFDQAAQCRIAFRIRHTVFGDHIQLLAVLRIELGLLTGRLEYRRLAILETSSHSE